MSEPKQDAEKKPAGGKNPLVGYLIFGVVCLVLIAGAAYGTLFVMQSMQPPVVAADSTAQADSAAAHPQQQTASHATHDEHGSDHESLDHAKQQLDSLSHESDDSGALVDELLANMEALESEVAHAHAQESHDEPAMSAEDSTKAAAWLAKEEARLATKEKELTARAAELEKLDKSISARITRLEQAESSRINNLAKVYDGMEPISVAKLMANLDDETVVSVLPRMKQKNASAVLALLPAERAATLSKQMITIAEQ